MKFSKYIGLATLCMCLNGCTDFIDNAPDDIITIDMIFDDKTRTEDWLAGVYQGIRDPYWDYTRYDAFEMLANDITPSLSYKTNSNFLCNIYNTTSCYTPCIKRL